MKEKRGKVSTKQIVFRSVTFAQRNRKSWHDEKSTHIWKINPSILSVSD